MDSAMESTRRFDMNDIKRGCAIRRKAIVSVPRGSSPICMLTFRSEQLKWHSLFTRVNALHSFSPGSRTAWKAGPIFTEIMRRSFALWALALLFALQGWAQPLRVVSWQLDDFGEPTTNGPAAEPDARRLRQVAAALKPLEADVILLQGLPDRKSVV